MAGRILAGRYELGRLLGRGGMGAVWSAQDLLMRREVAVKLLPHQGDSPDEAQLFFREAQTAGALNHPGVVTVYDLGTDPDDGTLYLVMELLAGRDLAQVLRTESPLPIDVVVDWAAQTADALDAAHRAGIVHRDLKPANLMLTDRGTIKILDFGIARRLTTGAQTSFVIGTPGYIPPERWRDGFGDARADLYSFGCLVHELLTGDIPFTSPDPVAVMYAHIETPPAAPSIRRPEVPEELDRLVLALLAKEPDDRPDTAATVRDALRTGRFDTLPRDAAPPAGPGGAATTTVNPAAAARPAPDPIAADTQTAPGGGRSTADPSDVGPPPAASPLPDAVPAEPGAARGAPSRRTFLRVGGAAMAAAAAGAGAWAVLTRGDDKNPGAANTGDGPPGGTSPSAPAPPSTAPPRVTGLRPWVVDLGSEAPVEPALGDGVLFTGTLNSDILFAFAPDNGTELWRFPGLDPGSGIATDGKVVYVASPQDSSLLAVDARTGRPSGWQFVLDSGASAMNPIVARETVLTTGYADLKGERALYGVDRTTGRERWRLTGLGEGVPVLFADAVYASVGRTVHSADPAGGTTNWTSPTAADVHAIQVTDNAVYATSRHGETDIVTALDRASGAKLWERRGGRDGIVRGPAEGNGLVYFGDQNGVIQGCDPRTLAVRWEFRAKEATEVEAAVGGFVYLVYREKPALRGVVAVDAATTAQAWMYPTKADPGPVVVADGVLYTAAAGDAVHAVDPVGGTRRWTYPLTNAGQQVHLTAFGEALYASAESGTIYALNTATGKGPAL